VAILAPEIAELRLACASEAVAPKGPMCSLRKHLARSWGRRVSDDNARLRLAHAIVAHSAQLGTADLDALKVAALLRFRSSDQQVPSMGQLV
jgi:hypothetical protein